MAGIVSLPRFGTGLRPVFEGSPLRVSPVAGRLRMAGNNIAANSRIVKRGVAASNAKAVRDAKRSASSINVKA